MTLLITINNTKIINVNITNARQRQQPMATTTSLAANTSGGCFCLILDDYRQLQATGTRTMRYHNDGRQPSTHHHCYEPLLVGWIVGANTFWTMTPSLERGWGVSVLGNNDNPFPCCKHERGVALLI
jgi:hypothetical protein